MKKNIDQRAEKTEQSYSVHDQGDLGFDKNRGAAGEDDQYGTDEHDGQIVAEFSPQGPWFGDVPDVIERFFNMAQNLDDGPVEDDYANTRHEPSPCFCQQIPGKPDCRDQDILLPRKSHEQLILQMHVKTKTFCNGKDHGQHRNNGQDGIEGQSGGPQLKFIFVETAEGKNDDPKLPEKKRFTPGCVLGLNMPDVGGNKPDDFRHHRHGISCSQGPCWPGSQHTHSARHSFFRTVAKTAIRERRKMTSRPGCWKSQYKGKMIIMAEAENARVLSSRLSGPGCGWKNFGIPQKNMHRVVRPSRV